MKQEMEGERALMDIKSLTFPALFVCARMHELMEDSGLCYLLVQ